MGEQDSEIAEASRPPANGQLLAIGTAIGTGLVLVVGAVSMFLAIMLTNDVAALEDQVRKSAKAAKAMQEELAALRELVGAQSRPLPAAVRSDPPPGNIDAADPARDCVIRSGDKGGIARCMEIAPAGGR